MPLRGPPLRIGYAVNPAAGRGRGAAAGRIAVELLRGAGHRLTDLSGPTAAAVAAAAGRALAGIDVLVAVGGDGLVHVAVNAVAGSPVPLAIVPAGTGNDIAWSLGVPCRDTPAAVALVRTGQVRQVDLGRRSGQPHFFAGVLAAGFDAVVNERANRMRWPHGRLRYTTALARELPVFRPLPYRLGLDASVRELEAMLVAVGNAPSYGGGMRVCPGALMDDGLLDVLVVHAISRAELLRVFPLVFRGRHVRHPAVEMFRAARVSLDCAGVHAYADGERFAPLPLSLEVAPGALRVLVPAVPGGGPVGPGSPRPRP